MLLDERVTTSRIESPASSSDLTPPTLARRTDGMKTVLTTALPKEPVSRNGASPPTAVDLERHAGLAGRDGRIAADRAVRVTPELELGELGLEGIEQEQPAGQRLADPEQDLERLVRLEHAEDAGHDAEDAGHGAAGRELRRRRGRVQAAVARALVRDERRQLALEPEDATRGRPGCRPRPPRR